MSEVESIIESAQQGEEDAWRELVIRYTKVVWAATKSYRFSFQEREDIVQEVFIKLLHYLNEYDSTRSRFTTYLTIITKHICIDRLRRFQIHPELPFPPEILQVLPQSQVDNKSGHEETIELLQKALDNNLTPKQRLVIKMFYIEQLSYEEIANIVGQNYDWVKNTLHRGRQRLKEVLSRSIRYQD